MECWSIDSETHHSSTPILHRVMFLPELSQESQVVLKKEPDVINAVFEHGDPFHPHSEREARNLLRVVTDKTKDLRIDHAGTQNFQPAGCLANPAGLPFRTYSLAATNDTLDINLGARFSERKKARAKSHTR